MLKKNHISFLLILLFFSAGIGQDNNLQVREKKIAAQPFTFVQIKTDSLFNSRQIISLLRLTKDSLNHFAIKFSYSSAQLKTTSSFAKSEEALAAINGGFFNRDSGGSVSYLEIMDSVISRTRNSEQKWGVSGSLINGAIIISADFEISIQEAKADHFYELSKQETAVLVTGPLLLLNSKIQKMPDRKFVTNRHPRTCLCTDKESVVFITIDGRNITAEGMSLNEVQQYLLKIGCIDAINLDGGGSTTMWIKDKGVVNYPSDKSGERPVANSLIVIKK